MALITAPDVQEAELTQIAVAVENPLTRKRLTGIATVVSDATAVLCKMLLSALLVPISMLTDTLPVL